MSTLLNIDCKQVLQYWDAGKNLGEPQVYFSKNTITCLFWIENRAVNPLCKMCFLTVNKVSESHKRVNFDLHGSLMYLSWFNIGSSEFRQTYLNWTVQAL